MLYNNVLLREEQASTEEDPFRAKEYLEGNPVASAYIKAGAEAILKDAITPFTDKLLKDLESGGEEGWLYLMEQDSHSLRSYLSHVYVPSKKFIEEHVGFPWGHIPSDVVNWMETMENSTGSYDKAFSEAVLHTIAFGQAGPQPTDWKCLE